jgi:integrase
MDSLALTGGQCPAPGYVVLESIKPQRIRKKSQDGHEHGAVALASHGQARARRSRRLAIAGAGGRAGRSQCRSRNSVGPSARKGTSGRAARQWKLKVGVNIPSPAEIKGIVSALTGRWRPLLLTAIFTGLRASELRGLRWDNVDLPKRELHVRERADEYKQLGRPKSGAGERTVPLTPMVVNVLRAWKLQCPKGELGIVFPTMEWEHCRSIEHCPRRLGSRADRRRGYRRSPRRPRDPDQTGQVFWLARVTSLLCQLVHQPSRRRGLGASAQTCSRAAWPFDHCHGARCVRTPFSAVRRQRGIGGR